METTYLYRHYNIKKELLYVGISLSYINRLSQHKDHSHWFNEISDVKIEIFNSRKEALSAETKAIKTENPKYNIQKRKTEKEIEHEVSENNKKRKAIYFERIVNIQAVYNLQSIQDTTLIRKNELIKLMDDGLLGYFEILKKQHWSRPNEQRYERLVTGWQLIDFIELLESGKLKGKISK